MYKQQLKRVKYARQAVKRQQMVLAEMELEGIVGVTFRTLTREITVQVYASGQLVDVCREQLRERLMQLTGELERLRLDWRESREEARLDADLLRAAKRAQGGDTANSSTI
jgi:hypothetical protein